MFENLAHPLHPVYDDGNNGGVHWWEKCCNSTSVRTQVAWMGADAYTMEESPRREVVRSSLGAGVVCPPFGGHSRSIPQGMIFDVQPLVNHDFAP